MGKVFHIQLFMVVTVHIFLIYTCEILTFEQLEMIFKNLVDFWYVYIFSKIKKYNKVNQGNILFTLVKKVANLKATVFP